MVLTGIELTNLHSYDRKIFMPSIVTTMPDGHINMRHHALFIMPENCISIKTSSLTSLAQHLTGGVATSTI